MASDAMPSRALSRLVRRCVGAFATLSLLLLYGCGGGGGDSPQEPLTSAPNTNTAQTGISSITLGGTGTVNAPDGAAGATSYALLGGVSEFPLDVASEPSLGPVRARVLSGPPSLSIVDSGSAPRLRLDATVFAQASEVRYRLAIKADRASVEQSMEGVIRVIAPTTSTTGQLAANGGPTATIASAGVVFSAPSLASPLGVKVVSADLPNGQRLIRLEFDRDIAATSEPVSIGLDAGTAGLPKATPQMLRRAAVTEPVNRFRSALFSTAKGHRLQLSNELLLVSPEQKRLISCIDTPIGPAYTPVALGGAYRACVTRAIASELSGPEVTTGGEPVIFVHGYTLGDDMGGGDGTWGEFKTLASTIRSRNGLPLEVYEFRWRSDQAFQDAAAELQSDIEFLNAWTGSKVHIVAHSFGGIVARTLLQGRARGTRWAKPSDYVASLLTLGTPHSGVASSPLERRLNGVAPIALPRGFDSL